MKKLGYRQPNGDHKIFYKHFNPGQVAIWVIYVDDIIITGNDPKERGILEKKLKSEFDMKN